MFTYTVARQSRKKGSLTEKWAWDHFFFLSKHWSDVIMFFVQDEMCAQNAFQS